MKRWTILLTMLVASCGGGPQDQTVASTDEPKDDIDGYVARIAELQRDLDSGMPAGTGPEDPDGQPSELSAIPSAKCMIAADLRDRICDLSDRICTIAEGEPEPSETAAKCSSARSACDDARARVAKACGEL
jgi:hypothetical protein